MARCISPFNVRSKDHSAGTIPVPCGRCVACVKRKISEWSFRLMQQDRVSTSAYFVTLTYDNAHVPITKNKFMTVNKKHLQDFFKRLRYYSPVDSKIKYYAASEYGSETKRPHYHVILFNALPEHIDLAWTMGAIHYGTVSAASVGYSLKYISKKATKKVHARDDRVPEFALMSKKLGSNYLTPQMVKWHESDMYNRMYIPIEQGKKISMPRYYKDKIYTKEQRQHIGAYQASRQQDELQREISMYEGDYVRDKIQSDLAAIRKQNYKTRKTDKL